MLFYKEIIRKNPAKFNIFQCFWKWLRNEQGQKIGYEVVGPLAEPVVCDLFSKKHRWFDQYVTDDAVEIEYRNSHRPVATEDEVIKAGFSSSNIDKLLKKAEAWYNSP